MEADSYFKIGYILKPHGLKGEVTVSLDADSPADMSEVESVFVEKNQRFVPYFIESISQTGDKAYIKFEEVDSLDEANTITKCAIHLPKSARPKSDRGEFYDDEIIGFEVLESEAGSIGKVVEIIMAGPNRLLSIDNEGKEILIPVNSPFITSINKSKKKISVTLPEGFLDI
jgi:16S rRNA processing protein RimM